MEDSQLMFALALIAGASAIEKSTRRSDVFQFENERITYQNAAVLLREKATELLYFRLIAGENTEG